MTEASPSLEELEATVSRMTERYAASDDPRVVELIRAVRTLDRRFMADLSDPRDLALARACALMFVRATIEGWADEPAAAER
ncbi:MAG: hypothetical protein ACYC10_13315 [Allorhizobium sp.]